MTTDITLDAIAQRLPGRVRWSGAKVRAACPAHGGNGENLSVFIGSDGRVHARCHSTGCTTRQVFAAIGIEPETAGITPAPVSSDPATVTFGITNRWGDGVGSMFGALVPERYDHVASYRYLDADGMLVGVVDRFEVNDDHGRRLAKTFRQRVPCPSGWQHGLGGRVLPLHRWPELLHRPEGAPVIVCEGEKDVHQWLADLQGWTVTTAPQGARGWRPAHTRQLLQATQAEPDVPLLLAPDADAEGQHWLAALRQALGHERRLRVIA